MKIETHSDENTENIENTKEIENNPNNSDVENNKDTAAASYFLILSPILLLTRRDSKFIQHHASQAFILFLIFIALWTLGSFLSFFAWLTVGVFFMALVGFIQAISGDWYKMPYIFDMVKDGISFAGIIAGTKKIFKSLKKIIIGLFPKNRNIHKKENLKNLVNEKSKMNDNENISLEKNDFLEKKIENLEKLLSQQNFFPNFSPLKKLSTDEKKEIENIIAEISKKDENATIEKKENFYIITGTFGIVYVGIVNGKGVKWGNG